MPLNNVHIYFFNFFFQNLNDVMKIELLEEKSKEEIASLWTQHFASKHVVSAVCIIQFLATKLKSHEFGHDIIIFQAL